MAMLAPGLSKFDYKMLIFDEIPVAINLSIKATLLFPGKYL